MRKVCTTAVFVALAWLSATGQAARMDSLSLSTTSILNPSVTVVVPVAGASITVCAFPASGQTSLTPCTNKAQVCTDQTASSCNATTNNPFVSDAQGNWGAWVNPGPYDISICTPSPVSCAGPYHFFLSSGLNPTTSVNYELPAASLGVAAPTGLSSYGLRWFDSGSNRWKFNNNNSGADFFLGRNTADAVTNKTFTGTATGNNVSSRLIVSQQSPQTGTGSAQAVTGFTYTIPANTISATSVIRIYWAIAHSAGVASVAYTMDLGDSTGDSLGSTASAALSGMIVITKGTTGNANVFSAVITSWPNNVNPSQTAYATSTTLVSQNCTIALKFNVANTDQITPQQFIVEQIQ